MWLRTSCDFSFDITVPIPYGNLCQRLIAPAGAFGVYTSAEVMTADYVDQAFDAPLL